MSQQHPCQHSSKITPLDQACYTTFPPPKASGPFFISTTHHTHTHTAYMCAHCDQQQAKLLPWYMPVTLVTVCSVDINHSNTCYWLCLWQAVVTYSSSEPLHRQTVATHSYTPDLLAAHTLDCNCDTHTAVRMQLLQLHIMSHITHTG